MYTRSRFTTSCSAVSLAACMLAFACKVDPPPQGECDTDGAGESGESGETGDNACNGEPPPEISEFCADPEFMEEPPEPASGFECEGQAGGAIVYNSVIIEIGGSENGGPGSVKLNPPLVNFPGDRDVQACCIEDNDSQANEENVSEACESDCGRAACNQVLDELRTAIESSDPSDGSCDPLGGGNLGDACRDRVKTSLEAWEQSLLAQYDQCISSARVNDDPSLPYDEFLEPFDPERKVVLANSSCNQNNAGCLFDAEVRLFCNVSGFEKVPDATCETAANARHPDAPVENMLVGEGGGVATLVRPNGQEVNQEISSMGGTLQRRCDGDGECNFRLAQFGFEVDGEVEVGPLRLLNPSATFFDAPTGEFGSNGEIAFDEESAYLWVTTVVEIPVGWHKIQLPWQFGIQADVPVTAVEGDGEFSLTRFYAFFGDGYELEFSTDAAPCTAL